MAQILGSRIPRGALPQNRKVYLSIILACNRKLKDLAAVPPLGTLVPRCDPNGNYSSEQCQGSNGQCFCVSETGEEIPNTRVLPGEFRSRNCDQERQRFTGNGFGTGAGSGSGFGAGSGFGSGSAGSLSSFVDGECPPAVGFGVCLNRCSSDSDCAREGKKCCSNGCGKQCMLPVLNNRPGSTNAGGFETKAGSCPINASPDLSRPSSVRDECNSDNTCIGVQKCCFTSSGYRCMHPVGDVGSGRYEGSVHKKDACRGSFQITSPDSAHPCRLDSHPRAF